MNYLYIVTAQTWSYTSSEPPAKEEVARIKADELMCFRVENGRYEQFEGGNWKPV